MLERYLWYNVSCRLLYLYYRKFSETESLVEQGYVANAYDPCVSNKVIRGKQSTICFHVDDCKISHVSAKVNEDTISWLRRDYESIFTVGSGEMKVAQGKRSTSTLNEAGLY